MSPWQMNGEAGVVQAVVHALCRLYHPVVLTVFGPYTQDLLQHRGEARAPSPEPDPGHKALHDGPQIDLQV